MVKVYVDFLIVARLELLEGEKDEVVFTSGQINVNHLDSVKICVC